jgi:hypothetical protein
MDVFQWHGEILDLPTDAVVLARSAVAPVQAFRYGTAAYGTLFHLEMQADGIRHLCKQCAADLDRAQLDAAMVSRQASGHLATFRGWAARLVDRLLEAVPPS